MIYIALAANVTHSIDFMPLGVATSNAKDDLHLMKWCRMHVIEVFCFVCLLVLDKFFV